MTRDNGRLSVTKQQQQLAQLSHETSIARRSHDAIGELRMTVSAGGAADDRRITRYLYVEHITCMLRETRSIAEADPWHR